MTHEELEIRLGLLLTGQCILFEIGHSTITFTWAGSSEFIARIYIDGASLFPTFFAGADVNSRLLPHSLK